jgi:hypothetical protein
MLFIKKTSKILIFVGFLFLLVFNSVLAQKIEIISEPGVPKEVSDLAQKAINNTISFFKENCNLELSTKVRILLVADDDGYLKAQIRENSCDEEEAARRVKTTKGWSKGDLIIQNVGGLPETKQRIFNMSHEVVHQFQGSVCSGKCNQVMWLFEGTADAIAVQIVEKCGEQTVDTYKKIWMNTLRNADEIPELDILQSKDDWYASLNDFKNSISYRVSGMAVLNLLKTKSYKDLFEYFKKLKNKNYETAFSESFGLDLEDYETNFMTKLNNDLEKED